MADGFYPVVKGTASSTKTVGDLRPDVGGVRRLIGWFDREHLILQDEDGKLRCARLANENSRLLEDRVWPRVSSMSGGKILLQSADECYGKELSSLWLGQSFNNRNKIIEPLSSQSRRWLVGSFNRRRFTLHDRGCRNRVR